MQGRNVYVRGVGFHPFGRHPGKTLKQLAATAALQALDDAQLDIRDVQAAFCGNAYAGLLSGQESVRGETWMRNIGIGRAAIFNIENACASGGSAMHLASQCIASGAYDEVLVVGAEKMFGDTVPLAGDARTSDLRTQPPPQKFCKQWVKPVFFGRLSVAGNRQENVLLGQLRQRRRASQFGKDRTAKVKLERVEQRQMHQ